jgi:hypothetical protein
VDISAAIRYMNDYVGGSWVVTGTDAEGRAVRQAERNVYLPQPNWIGVAGGEPIDVEQVECIAYSPDRQDIWWRTVRSPNGSADSDDGVVSFVRTPADQVEVRIFARQRFRLPVFVAALGVERWPTIHAGLVADAYARFFDGTLANLLAAYEERPYRIGRDAPAPGAEAEHSELRAVLSGAFALLARLFGWTAAGGVTEALGSRVVVEPLFIDEAGFTHFGGQQGPAFVSALPPNGGEVGEPLTPSVFLKELGRAVGRDLAALGISGLGGPGGGNGGSSYGSMDPAVAWSSAHLGMDPANGSRGWP